MAETIFIGVAWPTPNGPLHLGHVAGCYLPADLFARYHRLAGNRVLMVSGSDQHGTPVTVRAEQDGVTPAEVAARFHASFLDGWDRLGITFDLFTTTGTTTHRRVVHDLFGRLWAGGHLRTGAMIVPYCPRCDRALPDRYVEGTCPHCGSTGARGDQCDRCARPLDPAELAAPRCRTCGATPEWRSTEHVFLRLGDFQAELAAWIERQAEWRPNVRGVALAWLAEGLRDRAITRDLSWGVSVPIEGFEGKRIYVWFEAVIGYLSAGVEWADRHGDPEAWQAFWQPEARHHYFVGKDNIVFHTIIWPAILLGCSLHLPDDVPANEFLTLAGRPFSTSRHWAVWLPAALDHLDPDALRFALALNLPETGDADFTPAALVQANNDVLVATWGNLCHRVLSLVARHFDGRVPGDAEPRPADIALLAEAEAALARTGTALAGRRFRAALREALALARATNRYLDTEAPWQQVRQDRAAAAATLATALHAIDTLKVLFAPWLPFSSARLHRQLGHADALADQGWRTRRLPAGQTLGEVAPLFRKLEVATVAAIMPVAAAPQPAD